MDENVIPIRPPTIEDYEEIIRSLETDLAGAERVIADLAREGEYKDHRIESLERQVDSLAKPARRWRRPKMAYY